MIDALSHQLLLLLLNLAQVRSKNRIIPMFIEALEGAFPHLRFRWLTVDEEFDAVNEDPLVIEIENTRNRFGRLLVTKGTERLADEELALLRTAVGLVAVILENREQADHLAEEKIRLEAGIREGSHRIEETNLKLKAESEERLRTLEALKESESRHRAYFNHAPDGIFITDETGRFVEVNDAAERITGFGHADLLQMGFADLPVPEARDEGRDCFNRLLKMGRARCTVPCQSEDGTRYHLTFDLVRLGENRYLVFCKDVTETLKAAEMLQKKITALTRPASEIEGITFQDLFDIDEIQEIQDAFARATGVASIITDPEGKPITRPSNFCRLCNDIIRKTDKGLANCMHSDAELGKVDPSGPRVQPCLSGGLWDGGASICVGDCLHDAPLAGKGPALGGGSTTDGDPAARTDPVSGVSCVGDFHDGQHQCRHIANWLIGQVYDESLDEEAMLAYAREIGADEDEYREALCEVTRMPQEQFRAVCLALFLLARQLSTLAQRNVQQARYITEQKKAIEEKTLLEAQFAQSQRLESLGRLAGGVAHDFNNLLTGIQGYTELLTDDPDLSSGSRDFVVEIKAAADRAASLTQQLLAFSRRQVIHPVVINLNRTLDHAQRMLSRVIGEDIELDYRPGEDPLYIKADPNQIDQALVNLAVNARDAMPDGGRLTIKTSRVRLDEKDLTRFPETKPGEYVRLDVTDSGCGMTDETKARIFEPFFTTKDRGKGTGLGLATLYGMVSQNGGTIDVRSRPGRGTSFSIHLPLAEPTPEPTGPETFDQVPGGTETILLVEDEDLVRNLARKILAKAGYTVIEAACGEEALSLARERSGRIDLLLTDVIMPGMNGRELFEELKDLKSDLKVLFMSGYSEDVIAHHGVLEEGTHFIEKPFAVDSLARKIREALAAR